MNYTLQVSNHPGAGADLPSAEAAASWKTVYDGATTAPEARLAIARLSSQYRHVRAFRGAKIGRLWKGDRA